MQTRSFALSTLAAVILGSLASTAQAGPLIDWLFRGRQTQPSYPVGAPIPLGNGYAAGYPGYAAGYPGYAAGYPGYTAGYPTAGYAQMPPVGHYPAGQYYPTPYNNPTPYNQQYPAGQYAAGYAPTSGYAVPGYAASGYAANMGNYYGTRLPVIGPNGAGYTAQMPTGIAAATLPQAAMPPSALPQTAWPQPMSYVPNYSSNALKAPVTYYRPLLTTDPNTGAQVVAMAPCTSYQYLTQRVPALGQTALYGSYQPPQPMLQTTPTYTLPSGGIPLASGSVAPSTMGSGAVLGYSPYSTYQVSPPVSAPTIVGSSNYSTTPLGSTYSAQSYANPSGGSTGSYSQPIPGLVAPPAQSYPAPTYPSGLNPSTTTPGSVMPPPATGSNFDPANTPPSLPLNSTLRPRLQSIVPEVSSSPSGAESAQKSSTSERSLLSEPTKDFPVTNPIPAPEGMEKPSWSPGLLRNEDMTALRPAARRNELAGQSKKIHWASFEQAQEQGLTLSDSSNNQPKAVSSTAPKSSNSRPTQVEQPTRQSLKPSTTTLELGEPVGLQGSPVKEQIPASQETRVDRRSIDQRPTMVPLRASPVGQPAAKPSTGKPDSNGWTTTRK